MTKTEILNRLTTDLDYGTETLVAKKTSDLFDDLYEALLETLTTQEQRDIILELNNIAYDYAYDKFHDGIAFGFNLAKDMRAILENPASAFEARRAEERTVEEINKDALELIRKHKLNKRKNDTPQELEAKIEDAVKQALCDCEYIKAGATV